MLSPAGLQTAASNVAGSAKAPDLRVYRNQAAQCDGSEGLKLAIFESHKVCKYSTHMSQEYIHVLAPFHLDHWMLMDASLL
jgi:hypothetical protein